MPSKHYAMIHFLVGAALLTLPATCQNGINDMMLNAYNATLKLLSQLNTDLQTTLATVLRNSMSYGNETLANLTATFQSFNSELTELRVEFADSHFDDCFAAVQPLDNALTHSMKGVADCLLEIIYRPVNAANGVWRDANNILATLVEWPFRLAADCGGGGILGGAPCALWLGVTAGARLAFAAGDAVTRVTDTIVYFNNLRFTIAPCSVWQADYIGLAAETVVNVSRCIGAVVGVQ